jgi:hypothetical protein
MAAVFKIDSNVTGLRWAEELSFKVLPGTPEWIPADPNSYDDFGGEVTTTPRNPINNSRQRKKGNVTDLDATGGWEQDFTQKNSEQLLQGFFFADLRPKGEENPTSATVQAGDDTYEMAATAGFLVGSLVNGTGFTNAENNGIKNVTAVVLDTTIAVAETLVTEGSPPAAAEVVVVGHVGASADIDVDAAGTFPALTSTILDFTTLGLVEGEWIFIGGDGASEDFVNAENNGVKRIRTIAANRLEFDKSDLAMTTETGTGLTIFMYFGRVLKNELGSLIKRRTYSLERQMGAPDNALPAQIQAEYIDGAVPNEATLNIPTANKLTWDFTFIGADSATIDGPTALRTGNRPALEEADMYNTSSDFSRIRLAVHVDGTEAPSPLFAFAQELTISINNNVSPNKAVGTLGAFEVTAGTFEVGGSMTAYFSDITAVSAIRNNDNVTLDAFVVQGNAGFVIDLPLVTLGDGKANVEQDQPITLPLDMDAATAAIIDPNLDYTAMMVFWDVLPNAAVT